jgi:hypothetical protein
VRVPHSCIVPNVKELSDIFGIKPDDKTLISSPPGFDPSVIQM